MIESSRLIVSHPGPATQPLSLTAKQREECEVLLRAGTTERRVAERAQGLLLLADGVDSVRIARALGVCDRTVFRWRKRFDVKDPTSRLADAPRGGRPISLFLLPTLRSSSQKRVARRAT